MTIPPTRALLLLAPLALAACSGGQPGDTAASEEGAATPAASNFQTEIAPILTTQCATCHLTGEEAGSMSLVPARAVAALVGVKAAEAPALTRVVAGDPDKSYLVMKLEGTQMQHGGTGAQMPFGAPPLTPDQIAKFRKWIAEGAKP